MTERHWGMLTRDGRSVRPQDAVDDDRNFRLLHMRVFGSPDGKEWLARMWERKAGVDVNPNATNETLRWMEAQRQMLRDIDRLTAQAMAESETSKTKKQTG